MASNKVPSFYGLVGTIFFISIRKAKNMPKTPFS